MSRDAASTDNLYKRVRLVRDGPAHPGGDWIQDGVITWQGSQTFIVCLNPQEPDKFQRSHSEIPYASVRRIDVLDPSPGYRPGV